MTDIQAAVGREQLKRLGDIVVHRRILARQYAEVLADSQADGLAAPTSPSWARSNWQSYCVRLPADASQHKVMQRLLDAGISTRRGVMCSHREPACADLRVRTPLPHSEAAQDGCVLLPLHHDMDSADLLRVAAALRKACTA
jgi:dTDP-4-amino-4,6-dideoxygalactose transaminase